MEEVIEIGTHEILELDSEDSQEGKYLTFPLSDEEYGIEISVVTEIIGMQNITILPDTPEFVKGAINLRGKIIPVMDVRIRFNLEEKEYEERTCIIVVNYKEMSIGLIVDSVSEVLDINPEDVESPSEVNQGVTSKFIKAFGKVNDNIVIILDVQKLLFDFALEAETEELTTNN